AEENQDRHARRRKRDLQDDDLPSRTRTSRSRDQRIWRRSSPAENSRWYLYRHLVVHAFSIPLFRGGRTLYQRTGRISDEMLDRFGGEGDSAGQVGRRQPDTAEGVLREELAPARHTAVERQHAVCFAENSLTTLRICRSACR